MYALALGSAWLGRLGSIVALFSRPTEQSCCHAKPNTIHQSARPWRLPQRCNKPCGVIAGAELLIWNHNRCRLQLSGETT